MEQKRKINVDIAGISMTLVTDETDSFVDSVVKRMNESMNALLSHNVNRSRLDAAMLCAIGFCGDKLTADKRVRNLEAQISLYDVNLRKLRDEVASLKEQLANAKSGQTVPCEEKKETAEEKKHTSQVSKESSDQISISGAVAPDADSAKEDKLKLIESLLRKKDRDEDGSNQ